MRNDSRSFLTHFLEQEFRYVLLQFDNHSRLKFCDGETSHFGLDDHAQTGRSAEQILPFTVGLDTRKALQLHYVEFVHGIVCNIFLYPDPDGFHVILLDTGLQHDLQQEVQQQANENAILHYRLQQLDAQLQQTNQRLQKANKAKSEFISIASHELKTPLSSILGYAEMLQNRLHDQTELKDAASVILTSGNYLLTLIDNLLEQGRIEYHDTAIKRLSTDLSALIHEVEAIVRPSADKKSLRLNVQMAVSEKIILLLDEQHIRQILINLLSNAIKFTESGEVSLSVNYQDDSLEFIIEDTGIGIKDTQLDAIMQPFKRADSVSSIEGVGLGLSVSRKLIQLMGGALEIDSSHGDGTRVKFTIPASPATTDMVSTENNAAPRPEILLIDDDEDLSNLLSHHLKTEGYSVYTAYNAADGMRACIQLSPDLILLDHNLGDKDGIEVARYLNNDGYTGKIIMMTAASDQSLVERALSVGCIDMLKKPVQQQHLFEMLALHGF